MSRILLTSGPTRQYLDPVRYLSNGSSGRMGKALAEAALEAGHEVVIVSGPVDVGYPQAARVLRVISTEEMLDACLSVFPQCDGLIAAAAPCDYRPKVVASQKIRKTGGTLDVQFVETPDIVARLGAIRTSSQWMVAFALETEDLRMRAMQKLERKKCDLIVVNGPAAMHAADTKIEVIDARGEILAAAAGSKRHVAKALLRVIETRLIAAIDSRQQVADTEVISGKAVGWVEHAKTRQIRRSGLPALDHHPTSQQEGIWHVTSILRRYPGRNRPRCRVGLAVVVRGGGWKRQKPTRSRRKRARQPKETFSWCPTARSRSCRSTSTA